jgi:hypothetical protein
MTEENLYRIVLWIWIALALAAFVALLYRPAPYGRHAAPRTGRTLPSRWGWLIMESPAVLLIGALYWTGRHRGDLVATAFLLIWLSHYLYRTFLYPFLLGARGARPMPLSIVAGAFGFQMVNAYLIGRWLFEMAPRYPSAWLADPRFLAGTVLFVAGSVVNRRADGELRRLAADGYAIPRGTLFRRISCPNYLGEIVLWIGWALATWSLPSAAFALWTTANLAPRARSHHRFYRQRFPDYPKDRSALVPGLF